MGIFIESRDLPVIPPPPQPHPVARPVAGWQEKNAGPHATWHEGMGWESGATAMGKAQLINMESSPVNLA